jgi:hypothetical protein
MKAVFSGETVSQKVEDFRHRLGMSDEDVEPLKEALKAVSDGDSARMAELGMPPSSWNEVSFIFSRLVKSGFTK